MPKIRCAVKESLQKYEQTLDCDFELRSFGTPVKYELFQFDIEQLTMTHYILFFNKLGRKTSLFLLLI